VSIGEVMGHFKTLNKVLRRAGLRVGTSWDQEGTLYALIRKKGEVAWEVYEVGPVVGDPKVLHRWTMAQAGWSAYDRPSLEQAREVTVNGVPLLDAHYSIHVEYLEMDRV